jgi:hypothetical protein
MRFVASRARTRAMVSSTECEILSIKITLEGGHLLGPQSA